MHQTELRLLRDALASLQHKHSDVATLCRVWRAQTSLFNALPPKYEIVAEDLLVRLETGSLFSEESCSFSQDDLIGNLSVWLDKAEKILAPHQSGNA
jgi:hypothetical protein